MNENSTALGVKADTNLVSTSAASEQRRILVRCFPLWICLLLAILVRAWLIIHTHGIMDGDEATVGIQAEHILQLLTAKHVAYQVARFYSEPGIDVLLVIPLNRTVSPLDPIYAPMLKHILIGCLLTANTGDKPMASIGLPLVLPFSASLPSASPLFVRL